MAPSLVSSCRCCCGCRAAGLRLPGGAGAGSMRKSRVAIGSRAERRARPTPRPRPAGLLALGTWQPDPRPPGGSFNGRAQSTCRLFLVRGFPGLRRRDRLEEGMTPPPKPSPGIGDLGVTPGQRGNRGKSRPPRSLQPPKSNWASRDAKKGCFMLFFKGGAGMR